MLYWTAISKNDAIMAGSSVAGSETTATDSVPSPWANAATP